MLDSVLLLGVGFLSDSQLSSERDELSESSSNCTVCLLCCWFLLLWKLDFKKFLVLGISAWSFSIKYDQ